MKKLWIKWSLIGLSMLAVFVIGIPVLINECYKSNCGYITVWNAEDVLSYYGAVLGAFVAGAAIVVTIRFTQKQIQRESYLNNETEKWSKIESIITVALDEINPILPLTETMDTGMMNPNAAMITWLKYKMRCRTATDQLIAFLNSIDYPKVKVLLDHVNNATEEFSGICDKEIAEYVMLQNFYNIGKPEKILKSEIKRPHAFSEDKLSFCKSIIDKTNEVTFDTINKDIGTYNGEMVAAYEKTYRALLQLKGQTFETVNMEIQKNANDDNIVEWTAEQMRNYRSIFVKPAFIMY